MYLKVAGGGSKEILKFKFGGVGAPEKENALT